MAKTRIVGLIVTLVFLGVIVSRIELAKLGQALASANYLYVFPAAACTATSYVLRTLRWRQILAPTRRIAFRSLFPVLMIGFMANNVLPARIGEVVRAYVLGQREGTSKSLGIATIMLERLCDGLTLVLFLGLLSLVFPLPMLSTAGGPLSLGMEAAYVISAVFLLGAVAVFVLLWYETWARRVIGLIAERLPRRVGMLVEEKAGLFLQGLQSLRGPRTLITIVVLSIVVWSVETCSYFLVLRGFNLGLSFSQTALMALLLLVVVNLGIMLPSAPGYVGTFQFFAMAALGLFGVAPEVGLSIGLVSHGIQYVYVTGLGLIFFARQNLSLQALGNPLPVESRPTADVT